ncbi:hypothetical protein ACVGWC_18640, partial [Enterobacter hormaechei]
PPPPPPPPPPHLIQPKPGQPRFGHGSRGLCFVYKRHIFTGGGPESQELNIVRGILGSFEQKNKE